MSTIKITDPVRAYLPYVDDQVKSFLTYDDKAVRYQIHRIRSNSRYGHTDWAKEKIEKLKSEIKKTLIFKDIEDQYYTYAGLSKDLANFFKWDIEDGISKPEPDSIPMANPFEFELRDYQKEAVEKLIEARHGAVELPTGSGKSAVITAIAWELGLKTVIVAPLKAIAEQLYDEFVYRFGKKYVGMFSGRKKETNKLFTIAVAQSLSNIERDTELFDYFKDEVKVLMFDESHVTPAETFEKLCMGLFHDVPYRFFLSATQTRIDGASMVLRGIIGGIVCSRSYSELVQQKCLAQAKFKIFEVPGSMQNYSDPRKEVQTQLYNNPKVNNLAVDIATKAVNLANRPTLILIEEFKQFMHLRNRLDIPFEFIHGGVPKSARDSIPEEYWKCDKSGAIKRFNEGQTKLLIGTSAVSTGVDLKPTGCIIYLQGGKSQIKIPQAIGRGTRVVPGKEDFWVVDFDIVTSNMMQKHLAERKKMYQTMGKVETYGI